MKTPPRDDITLYVDFIILHSKSFVCEALTVKKVSLGRSQKIQEGLSQKKNSPLQGWAQALRAQCKAVKTKWATVFTAVNFHRQ